MTDDYLWDKSGKDDEVERLEKLLAPLAHREPRRWGLRLAAVWTATAAAVLLVIASMLMPASKPAPLSTETQEIDLGAVGRVVVEPNSRVTILKRGNDLVKLRLEVGTIHASISASTKPRLFQVETPTTTCVDLGCHYTLTVDGDGRTIVHVTTGRVAFVDGAREVYVPRGANCRAGRSGAGTPVWDDAPAPLVGAVRRYDDRAGSARDLIERCTQPRDSLMLWHLLADRDDAVVAQALDALMERGPAPVGVTREATLKRDAAALEAWKDHLSGEWW